MIIRIFLAYKFTGEKFEELNVVIRRLCSALEGAGHQVFCSFWKEDFYKSRSFKPKQIFKHALNELEKSDCIIAFVNSGDKSEGTLLEIGYSLANKRRFILAIRKGVKTSFLRDIADDVIEFENTDELVGKFAKFK